MEFCFVLKLWLSYGGMSERIGWRDVEERIAGGLLVLTELVTGF